MAARKTRQYELTDILIALLLNQLRKEVNRLDVMGFDQLNAPRLTNLTTAMIERLLKANKKAFLKIAKDASEEAAEDITAIGMTAKTIKTDEKYVDGVLGEYNPVTGYLYYPEADRKRARLTEALMAAVIASVRADYHKELRKFANLWHTQTLQYGETMVDKARVDTFKKNGIKYVRWVTEKDNRVCEECKQRDGKTYSIDKIPTKPHYRCRCWVEPMLKGNNGES